MYNVFSKLDYGSVFKIKTNDTLPNLIVNVYTKGNLGQDTKFNLTGVTAVTFTMIDECQNLKIYNEEAEILCTTGGTIQYSWKSGDTDKEGLFLGEFRLLFNDGKRLSVPTQKGFKIEVLNSINGF